MTNEQKKQAILEKIREVCDLKRLEFGCEIKYSNDYPMILCTTETTENRATGVYTKNNTIQGIEDIKDFEIIGLPVQLNDLLKVVDKARDCKGNFSISSVGTISNYGSSIDMPFYDLSLSVKQNLDNPALTDLIYELII